MKKKKSIIDLYYDAKEENKDTGAFAVTIPQEGKEDLIVCVYSISEFKKMELLKELHKIKTNKIKKIRKKIELNKKVTKKDKISAAIYR